MGCVNQTAKKKHQTNIIAQRNNRTQKKSKVLINALTIGKQPSLTKKSYSTQKFRKKQYVHNLWKEAQVNQLDKKKTKLSTLPSIMDEQE